MVITDFSLVEKIAYIKGKKFTKTSSFSTIPCDFSVFNIHEIDNTCTSEFAIVKASDVLSKCFNVNYNSSHVVIPLLQYNN